MYRLTLILCALGALSLTACDDKAVDDASSEAAADADADADADAGADDGADADAGSDADTEPGTEAGEGPPTCETDADCEDACPEGSLDCICIEEPMSGDSICAATCESDEDCAQDGFICIAEAGVCAPEGGGEEGGPQGG